MIDLDSLTRFSTVLFAKALLGVMILGLIVPGTATHISVGVNVSDQVTYKFTKTTTVLPNGTAVDYVLNYIVVENQNFPIPVEITVGSTMTIRIVDITLENITHEESYTWILRNGSVLQPKPLNFTRSLDELVPLNSALISTDLDLIVNFLERQKKDLDQNSPESVLDYEIRGDLLAVNFTTTNAFIQSASSLYFEYDLVTGWNTLARLVTTGNGDQLRSEIVLEALNVSSKLQDNSSDLGSLLNLRVPMPLDLLPLALGVLVPLKFQQRRKVD